MVGMYLVTGLNIVCYLPLATFSKNRLVAIWNDYISLDERGNEIYTADMAQKTYDRLQN